MKSTRKITIHDVSWPAVRAFDRAWAPHSEAYTMQAEADRAFDAGEWSDAVCAQQYDAAYTKTAASIGARYGYTAQEMEHMLYIARHVAEDKAWDAQQTRRWGPDPMGDWHGRNE